MVDHHIIKRHWYDSFLVSKKVGTVFPTHYVVIADDAGRLQTEQMQRVAYHLTHMWHQ